MRNCFNKSQLLYGLTSLYLLCSGTVLAQVKSKEINHQNQTWVSVNSTIRLNKKLGVIADLHMRRNNYFADPSFYFARVGFNYWLKENLTVAAGLGYLAQAPTKSNWSYFAKEKRIYQQMQLTSKLDKVNILQRLRNEQRWQQKIVNDSFIHQYKFSNRLRYLLSFNIPIFKNPHYPTLVLSDELAIQFGKEIVFNTFDQNRAFIGIKQPLSKSISLDMGYMQVFQQKATGYQYDKNNTWRLFFYYTPNLSKK